MVRLARQSLHARWIAYGDAEHTSFVAMTSKLVLRAETLGFEARVPKRKRAARARSGGEGKALGRKQVHNIPEPILLSSCDGVM